LCGHQPTTSTAAAGPRALLLCGPRGDHLSQALFAAEKIVGKKMRERREVPGFECGEDTSAL
jgi:hypothetical protein